MFLNNGTELSLVLCVINSLMSVKVAGKFFGMHAVDGYEGMEVQFRSFLSWTLDGR